MGVGIGGLITQLMQGDPTQQLAQSLAGPNPMAPGGPQPGAGGPPSPQSPQGMPPAQAYAPDPANASTIAMLLKVHQQDAASNDINRNVQMISSGFGTAQQQHDKSALINSAGQGGGDTLGALGEITKLQQGQMDLQNQQRFQASADLLGETVLGLKKGQGALLSSDPKLFELVAQHKLSAMDPTDLQKNIKAYTEQATAAGIPPDQINQAVQLAYTNSISPGTQDQKNMNRDIALWQAQNPGKDPSTQDEFKSLSAYKGYQEDIGKQGQAAGQEKIAAKTGLASALQQIKPIEDNLNQMFDANGNVKPEVIKAIQTPYPTGDNGVLSALTGTLARHGVIDQAAIDQKNNLARLQNQLSGNALSTMKNVRTQREFNALGAAASSAFANSNSAEQIQEQLKQLRDKFGLARANAIAAGGGEVPAEFAHRVSPDYLNGGALDNNATVGKPAAANNDFRGMSGEDVDKAVAALPSGTVFIGPDGKSHTRK